MMQHVWSVSIALYIEQQELVCIRIVTVHDLPNHKNLSVVSVETSNAHLKKKGKKKQTRAFRRLGSSEYCLM